MEPNIELKTPLQYFYQWEQKKANEGYLYQPFGDDWKEYTWAEVGQQARRMAAYLQSLGLPPKSNIGLVSKNCAHWIINDLAILMAGHVSVPFYPTLTADQLNQVLVHSGCKVLFIGKLDAWKPMKAGIPADVHCIAYPAEYENSPVSEYEVWDDIIARTAPLTDSPAPNLDDLMSIVYTSGTTGVPKGVMMTHMATAVMLTYSGDNLEMTSPTDPVRMFSYLPLCHIAERSLVESGSLIGGGKIYFAQSLDTFAKNLQAAQPTHFLAVPRIWTKFQMGILAKMPQKKLDLFLKIPILSGIVKKKIKVGLGLQNARFVLTGAAPMPAEVIKWFRKLDIHIREAYGMTENLGVHSIMPREAIKDGTVGRQYPGVETRIDPITGEVQMKAPWNTIGYYKEPEQTAALLKDGWLCTGDMGEITPQGYIKITGRVKDMFKTAKGEYVVPAPIEFGFATNNFVEQVCVAGASLPQPIALVVLSDIAKSADKAQVMKSLADTVAHINPSVKHYEHIKKVIVMQEPWTVDNNMLTPTMKIKRNVVETTYKPKMETWYNSQEIVIWDN